MVTSALLFVLFQRHVFRSCSVAVRVAFFVVNDSNANVALETGFAIGWGKPAFLISKGEPFSNVRGLQRIQ